MDNIAIKVDGVSKIFKLPQEKTSTIKSRVIHPFKKSRYEKQKALDNTTFEVKKGEFFGIVGRNGSGKSTLLKILAGIYKPSTGSVQINGKLTPFIELGVGFSPELSGRENIFLNGALLGFSRKEVSVMYDDIVSFAELERFMDQKLKNYSNGMQVRLAFSIAIRAQSEILIIDEVLAVGDAAFQKKCIDVFRKLKEEGRTIVLVTHDMGNVERFCDRALILDKGAQIAVTDPHEASIIYSKLNIDSEPKVEKLSTKEQKVNRYGSGEVIVDGFKLSRNHKETNVFETGESFTLELNLKHSKKQEQTAVFCGLAFFNSDGQLIAGPNNDNEPIKGSAKSITFSLSRLIFTAGEYKITTAIYNKKRDIYDFADRWITFSVVSDHQMPGNIELIDGVWSSEE